MKPVIEINEANFESEVIHSNRPVLVDFWAEWCGPCKMLAPVLNEIADEIADRAKIVKINVDENPGLSARFGVQAIPTLLYFSNGKLQDRTTGVAGKTIAQPQQSGKTRQSDSDCEPDYRTEELIPPTAVGGLFRSFLPRDIFEESHGIFEDNQSKRASILFELNA